MRENTIRSQSSVLVISEREIFLYNFDNVNRLMGEHNKRRYKSGISAENPFYTGRMVPANLREKPPIEIRDELINAKKSGRNKSEMEEIFLWNDNHIIHPLCTKNEFFK